MVDTQQSTTSAVPLDDTTLLNLGKLLYHQLQNSPTQPIDLTSIPAKQQETILQGTKQVLEEIVREPHYDDKRPTFPLAAALFQAGVPIETDLLFQLLQNQQQDRSQAYLFEQQLKHLYQLEQQAQTPTTTPNDTPPSSTTVSSDQKYVLKTSPQIQPPAAKIKQAHLFDRLIKEKITQAQKVKQEIDDTQLKYKYNDTNKERHVYDLLDEAREISAIQEGKKQHDKESLEHLAFLDNVLPKAEAIAWKHQFALFQAKTTHIPSYTKLLQSLPLTPAQRDQDAKTLLTQNFQSYNAEDAITRSIMLFEQSAQQRKESGGKRGQQIHRQNMRAVADNAILQREYDLAKRIYQAQGIIPTQDEQDTQFNRQLIRIADEQLTQQIKRHGGEAAIAQKLYTKAYGTIENIPHDKVTALFDASKDMGYDRDKFFITAYGNNMPAQVAQTIAKQALHNGSVEKAELYLAKAGETLTPQLLVQTAKEMLDAVHGTKDYQTPLSYFERAIAQGHRKLSFREFFEAHQFEFRYPNFQDPPSKNFETPSRNLKHFLSVIDMNTNTYDYETPTTRDGIVIIEPKTYTQLALHYALRNERTNINDLIGLTVALGENLETMLETTLNQQKSNSSKLKNILEQLNPAPVDSGRKEEIAYKKEKEQVYGKALDKTLNIMLNELDERGRFDSYSFEEIVTEKIRYTLQQVALTTKDQRAKKEQEMYFSTSVTLAKKVISEIQQLETPTDTTEEVNDQLRIKKDNIEAVAKLVLTYMSNIAVIPAPNTTQENGVELLEIQRNHQQSLEAIATIGEYYCVNKIEDRYETHQFDRGWDLILKTGIPHSQQIKTKARSRAQGAATNKDTLAAQKEWQRLGEFDKVKALQLAQIALQNAHLERAGELYALAQEWHAEYCSTPTPKEQPTKQYDPIFGLIYRAVPKITHIPLMDIYAALNVLMAENNATKVISLEKELEKARIVVKFSENEEYKPITTPAENFIPVLKQYIADGKWQDIAYVHEHRPDINVPQRLFQAYRGQIPLETITSSNIPYAIKVLPAQIRIQAEAMLAKAQETDRTKRNQENWDQRWTAETLGPKSMSTQQYFTLVFEPEFEGKRKNIGSRNFTRSAQLREEYDSKYLSVLDDQEFLQEKITENNPKTLETLAYAAVYMQYDLSTNPALNKIVTVEKEYLQSIIPQLAQQATSENCLTYREEREASLDAIRSIATYIGEPSIAQFLDLAFPKEQPKPSPSQPVYSSNPQFKEPTRTSAAYF
ncbi:MAG: hypothetical protein A2912_02040 [Candidatus Buchananbacteria bacterium RIFCSPLOWO2_01_FULL_40_23b]|uniref:Uncharacterized protein n=1 Tax=Candidatus Buchananbacteria bacterium RIFCSPLOWO2_01_FULL_40_23b TaxID=1797544 RepID=A0A1G1YLZ7_9BACT|nr:MAG: hypothetical protein A2912_02040 [Candidatus Buchananbacteria bacterium RIFCSPLOWO2_01_FULL_40_23b]